MNKVQDHPSYKEGYNAAQGGTPKEKNPYTPSQEQSWYWQQGWCYYHLGG